MKTFHRSKDKRFIKLEQVNLIIDKQKKKEEAHRQEEKKKTDRQQLAIRSNIAEGVAGLQGKPQEQVHIMKKYHTDTSTAN